jgi:hypothetical protein
MPNEGAAAVEVVGAEGGEVEVEAEVEGEEGEEEEHQQQRETRNWKPFRSVLMLLPLQEVHTSSVQHIFYLR